MDEIRRFDAMVQGLTLSGDRKIAYGVSTMSENKLQSEIRAVKTKRNIKFALMAQRPDPRKD
jgi:hypothetical protein